ncbi:ribonuclease-like 3 [Coregonus clupeaformis]|uniref:Ribonuclease A-domain domain-containing protein n=1 Tax=Coregonus suidteri TaxID=861788 RepID=A0AAN8L4R8_9TELE|nr:ribonuclease-like 3 [Coregonus clupeaformis]
MVFQRAFLFLVLMCATVMVHGQPADVSPRYQRFLLQHVKGGMTIQNCQHVMSNLRLTGTDGKCKWKNTFILANPVDVKPICGGGGTRRNSNLFESNNPFSVVICQRTGGDYHPNCKYRGSSSTKRVVIACDGKWPVHYDGDIDIGITDGK